MSHAVAAITAAGLDLELHRDLSVNEDKLDVAPWYWVMGNDIRDAQSLWDILSLLKKNRLGAMVTAGLLGLLETVGIVASGTKKTADVMGKGADALVEGEKRRIFTPMLMMVGKKPSI
jgi:sterol 24-C-methyltransferase